MPKFKIFLALVVVVLAGTAFMGYWTPKAQPVYADEGVYIPHTPTGCPYGDSIPLGAECDKFAPAVQPLTVKPPITEFQGK